MKSSSSQAGSSGELPPLQPDKAPPKDRFCDVVLDGGVVNGVVYPGLLVELARKFHFHGIAGTSVGAIAASLAAACEYSRRYGREVGFNEGLAKMPRKLAEWVDKKNQVTKIRSLFQPDPNVKPLFDFFVDWLGVQMERAPGLPVEQKDEKDTGSTFPSAAFATPSISKVIKDGVRSAFKHLGPGLPGILIWAVASWMLFTYVVNAPLLLKMIGAVSCFLSGTLLFHPLMRFMFQVGNLYRLTGFGACTGKQVEGSPNQALVEWLHEGIQKSAGLPLHSPLTFEDLWKAPGGPDRNSNSKEPRGIDFRVITACLSHGRTYELPQAADDGNKLFFRLSEFRSFFPDSILNHLRLVSQPLDQSLFDELVKAQLRRTSQEPSITRTTVQAWEELSSEFKKPEDLLLGFLDPDLRILPRGKLPIVVAARLSMSCPILFACVPLVGFNRDVHPEHAHLVRLWFSDGGIGSNFPVHLFDKALPRWPTFAVRILDVPARNGHNGKPPQTYLPYFHEDGSEDNLLFPKDTSAFTSLAIQPNTFSSFVKFAFSIYTSAKDGHDQSYGRMPDVRNRVIRLYMNRRAGNMLNLKMAPENIRELGAVIGKISGRNAAQAYLQELSNPRYSGWVSNWTDHRWVRMTVLIDGLREYLDGVGEAMVCPGLPGTPHANSLLDQIDEAVVTDPLVSPHHVGPGVTWTPEQVKELKDALLAIRDLELRLKQLNRAKPYEATPMPRFQTRPRV